MSRKPVVAGFKAEFKGVDFARYVIEWHDSRPVQLVPHRLLKRDGAVVEPMSRQPHETKFLLAFVGSTWRADFLRLQATIDEDPKGVLIHPVHGSMRAACRGHLDAGMNVETAPGLYNVPLVFLEDRLGAKSSAEGRQAASARREAVAVKATSALRLIAKLKTAEAAMIRLAGQANAYASAALDQAAGRGLDASLGRKLDSVRQLAEVARAAVRAEAESDAAAFEVLLAIEAIYDACAALDDAVRALRPQAVLTVTATTHLAAIAQRVLGPTGAARLDEILASNAGRILSPHAVRAGTQLDLPQS